MHASGWEPSAALNMEAHIAHGHEISDSVVGGRFRIGPLANVGGMGLVYAAEDLARDGGRVAFKVMPPMTRSTDDARHRFLREAEVLASLRHPGIVEYIAHGLTSDGRPYLVMEWLEGEELEKTLARPLPIAEAIVLVRRIAEALAFAHDRGITHRDLKPSNIILRKSRIDNPAIVDFGVARWLGRSIQMTRTGMLIGTPGYMAPEQARGQGDIGPSADVFALGCMLYQCLTGKPPFAGDHITAVLTKVLFEEVPPMRFHRPDTPPRLDTLLSRMLLKDATERPRDARALLAELDALDMDAPGTAVTTLTHLHARKALTDAELALYCLVLATPERSDGWTVSNSTIRAPFASETNWPRETLERLGVQLESLADGSLAIVVGKGASAKEQAVTAARCALLLLERNPSAQVTLVTGRGVLGPRGGVPEGEVFERASALLRDRAIANIATPTPRGIWIDETTASVLGPGYDIERTPKSIVLTGIDTEFGKDQSPLGDALSCIGREREIGQLLSTLDGVIEDERNAAVVMTSPPGMGKSRLLRAFLDRVRKDRSHVTVLHGRGDPSRSDANHGVLAHALRELADVHPDDSKAEAQRKLEVRLGACMSLTNRSVALDPVLEVCLSPESMRDVPAGFESGLRAWISAECARHPMVLAVDDFHWVDASTIRFIEGILRSAPDMPLFVVTTQRVAVEPRASLPWQGRAQELRLSGLSKRAAERFVRTVLGHDAEADIVARLVRDAGGNPLFLEELVRAFSSGNQDETPAALLAILQARIQHLSAGARRALRAASLFGHTFWRRGVAFLLGLDRSTDDRTVGRWLDELLDAELIELHADSRFPDDTEYAFRSGHVRDAANGLLTDGDRDLGRALVGVFLEQAGEDDVAVLAGHTHKIVQYLQKRHNAYFVARLSMLTGIPLHTFKSATPDNPAMLKKLRLALGQLLHGDEIAEVRHLFRDV
ncbi:MAG: protein kinase [Polyangiaceae bacterium]|nr:protein kinase [Polyangiaceae bacterium]